MTIPAKILCYHYFTMIRINLNSVVAALYLIATPLFAEDPFSKIPQDGGSDWSSPFILPNEDGVFLFHSPLADRTGALIATGTFRSLAALSMGQFSLGFLFDYNNAVCKFNQKQITELANSETAGEFLAKLSGRPPLKEVFEGALAGFQYDIDRLKRELIHATQLNAYVLALVEIAQRDPGVTFLKNKAAFKRIRDLAKSGKIYVLSGDLTGKETLAALAKQLRAQKIKVGAIDLSNAVDYVILANGVAKFRANLKKLPWSDDAVINFTVDRNISDRYREKYKTIQERIRNWLYFSMPSQQYIAGTELFAKESDPSSKGTYATFIESLFNTQADLSAGLDCSEISARVKAAQVFAL